MGQFLVTVLTGAVVGSLLALLAFGIVLTYRASGIFNFAQGAMGMLFAFVYYQLTQGGSVSLVATEVDQSWRLSPWIAVPLVVGVLAPATGWLLDRVMFRKLRTAETHVQIVSTLGLLVSIHGLVSLLWGGATSLVPRSVFPHDPVTIGSFTTPASRFWTVGLTIALALGLLAFLRFSSLGVRMRAVVDRAELAELVGIDSARVSALSWAVGSGFAALAGILVAPVISATLDVLTIAMLVIPATAAAVIGRLRSLPLTLAGGVAIGVGQTLSQTYGGDAVGPVLQAGLPFLVLFGALALPIAWTEVRAEAQTPPTHAIDADGSRSGRARAGRLIVWAGVLLLLPKLPFLSLFPLAWAQVPAVGLVLLSLVLLVGYAGQISLAQAALAGVGAVTAAHLTNGGIPFLVAALLGGAVALVPGALLAWRAVRLPPLYLGLASLAFAALFKELLYRAPALTNGTIGVRFQRPGILQDDYWYYVAGLVVFALAALLVRNVRRGSVGLALTSMRDSAVASAGFGRSLAQLKLTVFALSAFLAGLGGALMAGGNRTAEPFAFETLISLMLLAIVVIGGVRYIAGALVGGILFSVLQPALQRALPTSFSNVDALPLVLFGLAAIQLATHPGGIVQQTLDGVADARERRAARRPPPPDDLGTGWPDEQPQPDDTIVLERPVGPAARR